MFTPLATRNSDVGNPRKRKRPAEDPTANPVGLWKWRDACESCRKAKRSCDGSVDPRKCCSICKTRMRICTFLPSDSGGVFVNGKKRDPPPKDAKVEIYPDEEEALYDQRVLAGPSQDFTQMTAPFSQPVGSLGDGINGQDLSTYQQGRSIYGGQAPEWGLFQMAQPLRQPTYHDLNIQPGNTNGTGYAPLAQTQPYGAPGIFANGLASQARLGRSTRPRLASPLQQCGQASPTPSGYLMANPTTLVGNGRGVPVVRGPVEQPYSYDQPFPGPPMFPLTGHKAPMQAAVAPCTALERQSSVAVGDTMSFGALRAVPTPQVPSQSYHDPSHHSRPTIEEWLNTEQPPEQNFDFDFLLHWDLDLSGGGAGEPTFGENPVSH